MCLLTLQAGVACAQGAAVGRSGFDFMSRELQSMQRDDALNPGMLWVREGQARWGEPAGAHGKACADCHGRSPEISMRGVAARHPVWDGPTGKPITLPQRIAQCQARHQGERLGPGSPASEAQLALEAAVAHASRGLPVSPSPDPRLQPWRDRGYALWRQRLGQLDLSCAQCHDERVGLRLGGALIPPGNAMGYPAYRLEWQSLGPLQRRLRNCMTGVRAEPFAAGSDEALALEVFLAWRDRGLVLEAPSVRP